MLLRAICWKVSSDNLHLLVRNNDLSSINTSVKVILFRTQATNRETYHNNNNKENRLIVSSRVRRIQNEQRDERRRERDENEKEREEKQEKQKDKLTNGEHGGAIGLGFVAGGLSWRSSSSS